MMTKPWVCIDCGARQADGGTCATCRRGEVLDARQEQVRELMADVDLRLGLRRDAQVRWLSVVVGVAIVFALWFVPGYWRLRGSLYPGLPFYADQWGFMIGLAALFMLLGKRALRSPRRFPYLDESNPAGLC